MALESFFTSIELEGGLVSTSQVEKLVSLIQQDKVPSCNDDLCRNWITIAKTLAITQSIDCLTLFVQLGGPKSLDRWLQEAQKGDISSNGKLVEELIIAVLNALRKLPLEEEELKECGIKKTIVYFLTHKNFEIQDLAKNLSAGWGNITDMDADQEGNKSTVPLVCEHKFVKNSSENTEHLDCVKTTTSLTKEGATAEESCSTLAAQDTATNPVPHKEQRCVTHGLKTESSGCAIDLPTSISVDAQRSDPSDIPPVKSSVPSNMPQKSSAEEVISKVGSSGNITGLGHDNISESEGNKLIDENCSESGKSRFENDSLNLPLEASKKEQGDSSLPMSKTVNSSSCLTETIYPSHSAEKCDTNAEGKERISNLSMDYCDMDKKHNESQSAKLTEGSPDYWKRIMQQKPDKQNDVFLSSKGMMQNLDILHGKDGLRLSTEEVFPFREDVTKDFVVKSDINMKAVKRISVVEEKNSSSILTLERENMDEGDGKTLEMELAYGVVDALEVARQVAKEVEEEMGIYRDASCSSSSKMDMDGETIHPSTADSADTKTRSEVEREESCNECTSLKSSHSFREVDLEMTAENEQSCSEGEEAPQEVSGIMPENEDRNHDQESSQLTTAPQESSISEKIHLGFDLNEDIQMEEGDCPEQSPGATACSFHVKTLSAPIPVVAASKGPLTGSASRLHFEGELGWRGTAATSAFRPAPSRRTPDKGNTCSIEENYILRQSDLCSGIDLNVADGGDSAPMIFLADRNGRLDKHGQISLSLPSDDSSMEVSSKRAERLNLDLNHSGEIEESCQDLLSDRRSGYRMEQPQNESLSTSAAPLRVPARNFDLNDPSFSDASHEPDFRKPSKMAKFDDSVVSIMESRIQPGTNHLQAPNHFHSGSQWHEYAVEHKQLLNEMQPYLVGAVPYISQMGKVVPVQPTLAFATQPAFPYSGMGLSLSVPPSSTSHSIGAVPCMLDARGTTSMPQMLGPGTFAAFPRPFFMVAGMQGTNTNPSRPSLDLNATGSTSLEADSRGGGGVRNRFFPGGGPVVEDHPMPFQVSVAGTSVKHKEPDCGWEPYQVGYKRT